LTGVSNRGILENLQALDAVHHNIWIRIPVIPGFNDAVGELENIASLVAGLHSVKLVNLLPFHRSGLHKYERLGWGHSLDGVEAPSAELMEQAAGAFRELNLPTKIVDRTKNFFALGMMYWMYNRSVDTTVEWIKSKFKNKPDIVEANTRVLKAGWNFAETTEIFNVRYDVKAASLPRGKYRNVTGNTAVALGLVVAASKAKLDLFLGSYPITPASDILHELSMYKEYGVKTFQAEDEIAAITSAIGASFGGALADRRDFGVDFGIAQVRTVCDAQPFDSFVESGEITFTDVG